VANPRSKIRLVSSNAKAMIASITVVLTKVRISPNGDLGEIVAIPRATDGSLGGGKIRMRMKKENAIVLQTGDEYHVAFTRV
jgi:hypothetical protein